MNKQILITGGSGNLGTVQEIEMGDGDFKTVELPRGYPHIIQNIGLESAYVLIYRYSAWSLDLKEQFDISFDKIKTEQAWVGIRKFVKTFEKFISLKI